MIGDLAYFTINFAPKIGRVFLEYLCQNLIDIQNGHTCGGSVLAVLVAYQNHLVI